MVGTAITGPAANRFSRSSYFRFLQQALVPAVIVDHDGDVIRIIERRCAAIEHGIVEVPFRRSELPDKLGRIVRYFS
jgi:hypothetical protein